MFKIFKSKIVQYGAIAAVTATAIGVTSGIVLSQNSSPQSQNQLASASPSANQSPESTRETETLADIANSDLLAQRPEQPPEQRPEQSEREDLPSGRMLKNLNLSPSQLQKLKEIRDRDRDKIRNLSQQVRQANRELRELLGSETSVDSLRGKHKQIQDQQRQLRDLHFERMLAMREVLTPQQRSQLQEILKNRAERMKDRMNDRMQDRMREGIRERSQNRLDGRMDRRRNPEELPLL